jgi:hypothetical protein
MNARFARSFAVVLTTTWLQSCATLPRPAALDVSARASEAPAISEARRLAPQAYAHAEQLRLDAERAFRSDTPKAAELIAKRSLVAYQRAEVQAQTVRAAQREANAKAELAAQRDRLVELGRRQTEIAAETRVLELKVKVARDAQPRLRLEPSSPKREAERRVAARAIATEAGLLCEAAHLLEPKRTSTAELLRTLQVQRDQAPRISAATALDESLDARSRCLAELAAVRRGASPDARAHLLDEFQQQLSQAIPSGRAFRDDRGVVFALTPFDKSGQLTALGRQAVTQLAEASRSHAELPLQVVLHGVNASRKPPAAGDPVEPRAQALRGALAAAGLPDIEPHVTVGYSPAPFAPQKSTNNSSDYVEFVFVAR